MASSIIKVLRYLPYNNSIGNISMTDLNNTHSTGLYHAYFSGGDELPWKIRNVWGLLLVSNRGDLVIEQIVISIRGIIIRHYESNSWSEWSTISIDA